MAESQQGIRALRTGDVQSILEGESENDSQRSLPQVPNETIDATGLSGVRQNLSSLFSHFRRGLASAISQHPTQQQNPASAEVDADQLSPTSLQTQLTAYQATVRDLHDQNNRNAELLGRLETMVTDKEAEISRLQTEEMQKDLWIEAQQRDFQNQLIAEQTARQQVSSTLELLGQELETLKLNQHNQNPMDISSSTDTVSKLNRVKQQAEQEKRANEEKLAKLKAEHEQLLQNKNREITSEIERIKQNMEEQMRKESELTAKANEIQMQTIMSELHVLKENQVKDTTDRKVGEKVLLDNIKASIDPILNSDFKSGEPIGIGARLKGLQEEVNNYCPPTVNKKCGAAISTDDTIADWMLGGTRDTRHVDFASTPVKSNISNININVTPPRAPKEDTLAESLLQNTMQTLASEFKPVANQKFKSSGVAHQLAHSWCLSPGCRISSVPSKTETLVQTKQSS